MFMYKRFPISSLTPTWKFAFLSILDSLGDPYWLVLKKVYTRKKCKGADASVPGRRVVRRRLICSELKTGDNP